MCIVLLSPGVNPNAVNEYIIPNMKTNSHVCQISNVDACTVIKCKQNMSIISLHIH